MTAPAWTPEEQLKMLERIERLEKKIDDIFKQKGAGGVRITGIDWEPKDESPDQQD